MGTWLDQTRTFFKHLRSYFAAYGGWEAVIFSPLLFTAIVISGLSFQDWQSGNWADLALSIIPNLLGFSLGTYALLFSLLSSRIRLALRALKNKRGVRYLDEMNATFFHFIFMQICAMLWAYSFKLTLFWDIAQVIRRNYPTSLDLFPIIAGAGGFVGCLLLIYSLTLVVAASQLVFRIAKIVDPDPT